MADFGQGEDPTIDGEDLACDVILADRVVQLLDQVSVVRFCVGLTMIAATACEEERNQFVLRRFIRGPGPIGGTDILDRFVVADI